MIHMRYGMGFAIYDVLTLKWDVEEEGRGEQGIMHGEWQGRSRKNREGNR